MMCLFEIQGISDLCQDRMVSQESFKYNIFNYLHMIRLRIIYLKLNNVAAKIVLGQLWM